MSDWLAGVDGCKGGWIAAFVAPTGSDVSFRVMDRFSDILTLPERPQIIAVDIPIGLPDHIGPNGRGPEAAVRPLLGQRQSSVFAVPSRKAVFATDYRTACQLAVETSCPPKKVSKQLYMIAPKIREVDQALRGAPDWTGQIYEVHPEVAFWRLNGGQPLPEPKKIKGRPHEPGLALRRTLLVADGFSRDAAEGTPPKGAAADDLVDALACAAIARRIRSGRAVPFPDPPLRDEFGLPMAIWA